MTETAKRLIIWPLGGDIASTYFLSIGSEKSKARVWRNSSSPQLGSQRGPMSQNGIYKPTPIEAS